MKISMKSYEEIVESLGGTFEFVDPKYAWRAYKGGEYLVFSDKPSALGYSRLVEKFIVNQEEYDLNMSSHMAFEDKVKDLWENELWHTTSRVPYSVFKLSLIKACDEYNTWEVYDPNNNYIDTVYFNKNMTEQDVRMTLVNWEGYPCDIELELILEMM